MTVPLVVVAALGIAAVSGNGPDSTANPTSGKALSAIKASAPPHVKEQAAACTKVLAALPVKLGALDPRIVHTTPDTPDVVAWGNPAVILSCGAARPRDLVPGSSYDFIAGGAADGPFYDVISKNGTNVWTTVDRAPYISIVVPAKYQGADVLPPLSMAIAGALPSVCSTDSNEPDPDKLCTRRK